MVTAARFHSYQKRCHVIPIGHHKVMIKHFPKFIVVSRASFLNEFLTPTQKWNKTNREMGLGEGKRVSGDGWEHQSKNLRLIFDCIFVTLTINVHINAFSHSHFLILYLLVTRFVTTKWSLQSSCTTIISFSFYISHSIPITKCVRFAFFRTQFLLCITLRCNSSGTVVIVRKNTYYKMQWANINILLYACEWHCMELVLHLWNWAS